MIWIKVELWNDKHMKYCSAHFMIVVLSKRQLAIVSTQTQQKDHSLETVTNHEWSGPQGWNSVNARGAWWKVALEMSGSGKTSSTGSSKAWQKRLGLQYFNTGYYTLDRWAHFGQCSCGQRPKGFKVNFQHQKQKLKMNMGVLCCWKWDPQYLNL